MLLIGRGIGTYLRCRRDEMIPLRRAAYMWLTAGTACTLCAAAAYFTVVNY
jgi:hypothetical protein